ncbi:hypothetical protein PIROE2DRAFT_17923 [Piromyces sp. E2]|nr:hypothetical protein PIROE2DRAFT_17923 [Piromyces sp. E2]|eukprot:OUM57163.1 hypothetical protein PIROE2DRAFT_17923 [Piromyces sp. E2]
MKIYNGEALFVKFYYIPGLLNENSPYILAPMPGIKKGISGTILVGYNFGIVGNIEKQKLQPAIEAIKFMTSRKFQKELVLKEYIISGISSLYEEDDVCSIIKYCNFYKYPQTIIKPPNVLNLDNYYDKFTNYFYDFLYRNESASHVLKKIDNLSKIYSVSLDTSETYFGIITNIIFTTFFTLILLSLILIHMKKYKDNYLYLPKPFWYILIFGIEMILNTSYTKLGTLYIIRLLLPKFNEEDEDSKLFEKFSLTTTQTTEIDKTTTTTSEEGIQKSTHNKISKNKNIYRSNGFLSKILEYHKQEYTKSEASLKNSSTNPSFNNSSTNPSFNNNTNPSFNNNNTNPSFSIN